MREIRKNINGTLCLLLTTAIWGSSFVAQSVGMDYIGPFTFQAVRCLIAALGLLPLIWIADRFKKDGKTFLSRWKDKKLWKAGLICSIPLFVANNLQQLGITSTDAGKSAFLTAMYIVIVPIFGLFRKEKPSGMVFPAVVTAAAGLYFLCCQNGLQLASGDLLLLGCALVYAIQITCVDIFAEGVDAFRLNVIQVSVCSLLSAVLMFAAETPSVTAISQCWFPLFYAGFLSMGIAFSMQIVGQQNLDASAASILMSLESVFAVLFGWLLLHETLSVREGVGCVLMFGAVILAQLPFPKKRKQQA